MKLTTIIAMLLFALLSLGYSTVASNTIAISGYSDEASQCTEDPNDVDDYDNGEVPSE